MGCSKLFLFDHCCGAHDGDGDDYSSDCATHRHTRGLAASGSYEPLSPFLQALDAEDDPSV